ncbi:GNAT family N-acetyltransferase [Treponema sp.]|uniref:GNAT family N-acetyltransferase n=1 Tax=Treponema sp. TaxID=166 RepID=UPI00257BA6A4|nr:GNAT family N-acetyltransferase [Treponema sp.]
MNKTNYLIRKETEADFFEVENLTGCDEHYVLHCYRKNPDFIPELSLVLELDKNIIGHVMYSRSHIDADDGTQIPVMTFGPISIHPDFKRKGFGKILLDCSMEKARNLGGKCLLICGNIATRKAVRLIFCARNLSRGF